MSEVSDGSKVLVRLSALARWLEDEGQYSIAKLIRALVEAALLQTAYPVERLTGREALLGEINWAIAACTRLGADDELAQALQSGATALVEGRPPLIHELPHPHVCRTCGHLMARAAPDKCPVCGARSVTFREFMPVYWLEALEPKEALVQLQRTPLEIAGLLERMTGSRLNQSGSNEGWTLGHLVTHLSDAQALLDHRLDLMLTQDEPALDSRPIYRWADRDGEQPVTVEEIFRDYQAVRQRLVRRLSGLLPTAWQRPGQHEEFGAVTIRQQVSYFAVHEVTHLPQLETLCTQGSELHEM